MRYPAAETAEKHERILNEALALFCARGFRDVTVGEIMLAAGLTHGPFYNHFASKEELIAACVEFAAHATSAISPDRVPPTVDGKTAFVANYLSPDHRDGPGSGCVLAGLASEMRAAPEARAPFTAALKASVEKIAAYFPWRANASARAEAIRMLASMVGALILARAIDDEEFSGEILEEVRCGILDEKP